MNVVSHCPFKAGQAIEFLYPVNPITKDRISFEKRCLAILKIRSCGGKNGARRTRHGRFLLLGYDLVNHRPKRFYLDLMRRPKVMRKHLYRVASYDPVEAVPVYDYVGPVFTSDQRSAFKELIDDVNDKLNEMNVVRNVTMRTLNG